MIYFQDSDADCVSKMAAVLCLSFGFLFHTPATGTPCFEVGTRKASGAKLPENQRASAKESVGSSWHTSDLPRHFEGEFRLFRRLQIDFLTGQVLLGEESFESIKNMPVEFQLAAVEMIDHKPRRIRWVTSDNPHVLAGGVYGANVSILLVEVTLRPDGLIAKITTAQQHPFTQVDFASSMEEVFIEGKISLRGMPLGGVAGGPPKVMFFDWAPRNSSNFNQFLGEIDFQYLSSQGGVENSPQKQLGSEEKLHKMSFRSANITGPSTVTATLSRTPLGTEIVFHENAKFEGGFFLDKMFREGQRIGVFELIDQPETIERLRVEASRLAERVQFQTAFLIPNGSPNANGSELRSFTRTELLTTLEENGAKPTGIKVVNVRGHSKEKRVEFHISQRPLDVNGLAEANAISGALVYSILPSDFSVFRRRIDKLEIDGQVPTAVRDQMGGPIDPAKSKAMNAASVHVDLTNEHWVNGADWLSLDLGWLFSPERFFSAIAMNNLMQEASGPSFGMVDMLRPWKQKQRNSVIEKEGHRISESQFSLFSVSAISELIDGSEALSKEAQALRRFLAPKNTPPDEIISWLKEQFPKSLGFSSLPSGRKLPVLAIRMHAEPSEIFALMKATLLQNKDNNVLVGSLSSRGDPELAKLKLLKILSQEEIATIENTSIRDYLVKYVGFEGIIHLIFNKRKLGRPDSKASEFDYNRHFNSIAGMYGHPEGIWDSKAKSSSVSSDLREKMRDEVLKLFPEFVPFAMDHTYTQIDNRLANMKGQIPTDSASLSYALVGLRRDCGPYAFGFKGKIQRKTFSYR